MSKSPTPLPEGVIVRRQKKTSAAAALPTRAPEAEAEGVKFCNFRVSKHVHDQLRRRMFEGDTTLRAVFMRALANDGFDIPADELEDRIERK